MESFEKIVKEKGKKYFGRFYPLLLESNLFLRNKYGEVINKVLLSGNSSILDLGCGTGVYLPILRSYGRKVYGIDKSHLLIKEAAEVLGQREGMGVMVAQAESLPFSKGAFGMVFVNDSLIHFERQETAIGQIKWVLASNGRAIFIEPNIINPLMLFTLFFFKDGRRVFRRNRMATRRMISRYFNIEEMIPFNVMYTNEQGGWRIALLNAFDKITSRYPFSIFSLRYIIIARSK